MINSFLRFLAFSTNWAASLYYVVRFWCIYHFIIIIVIIRCAVWISLVAPISNFNSSSFISFQWNYYSEFFRNFLCAMVAHWELMIYRQQIILLTFLRILMWFFSPYWIGLGHVIHVHTVHTDAALIFTIRLLFAVALFRWWSSCCSWFSSIVKCSLPILWKNTRWLNGISIIIQFEQWI